MTPEVTLHFIDLEDQVEFIKSKGYDIAIKAWHDNKPTNGLLAMVWRPGNVKETTIQVTGDDSGKLLDVIIAKIVEAENEPQ